jgi:hypothetical protein
MPINIQRPFTGADALMEGAAGSQDIINSILNNKLHPYRQQLMRAQAAEAEGKGAQSQMLANLFAMAQGLPPQGQQQMPQQGMPQDMQQGGQQNMSQGQPQDQQPSEQPQGQLTSQQQKAKDMLEHMGYWSPTAQEKADIEVNKTGKQKANERVAKQYAIEEDINDKLSSIESAISDPTYRQEIAGGWRGIGMGLPFGAGKVVQMLPDKYISQKAKNAYGTAATALGDIQSSFAARFKGAYSAKISTLVHTLKPAIGDNIAVQDGKVAALRTLNKIATDRLDKVNKYMREMGLDEVTARKLADSQMPFDKIEATVKAAALAAREQSQKQQTDEFAQRAASYREAQEKKTQQEPQKPQNVMSSISEPGVQSTGQLEEGTGEGNESSIEQGLMTVITPDGKEHQIYRDKLKAAKKKYPTLKVKKEKFNDAAI